MLFRADAIGKEPSIAAASRKEPSIASASRDAPAKESKDAPLLGLGRSEPLEVRTYITACMNGMVSLKSIHPQTRQPNFVTRNSRIKSMGLWVN